MKNREEPFFEHSLKILTAAEDGGIDAFVSAITVAMKEWSEKGEKCAESKFRELLEKGVKMKKWKYNREALHDR